MRRLWALFALIGLVTFQGFSLWHASHEEHHFCTEHGSYSHQSHHPHEEEAQDHTQSALVAPEPEHSHCDFGWVVRTTSTLKAQAAHFSDLIENPQTAWTPKAFLHTHLRQIYRLAPKQSPPRT